MAQCPIGDSQRSLPQTSTIQYSSLLLHNNIRSGSEYYSDKQMIDADIEWSFAKNNKDSDLKVFFGLNNVQTWIWMNLIFAHHNYILDYTQCTACHI